MRVEATLDGYWQSCPPDLVKEEILGDWMAALEAFTEQEIREGFREYGNGPDCKRKPKTGDIRKIILSNRATQVSAQPKSAEEPRKVVTAEEAQKILAETFTDEERNPLTRCLKKMEGEDA